MSILLFVSIITKTLPLPLNSPLLPSYDYVVVGGGPAGLTVANRLTEDPTINVLLLEAGPPDDGSPEVLIPGLIGADIGGIYNWNLTTVPQVYLDGRPRNIPQGHVLGGGTILNGMLWNRGGQGDYANWVALGNPGWSWNHLLPYFKKSETYTPISSEALAAEYSIEEYAPVHGFSGPVNVSFPRYFWNYSSVLFDALNEAGIPTAYDPNIGLIAGASFLPLDLDPVTEERCTARRAYYDPYLYRPNLWVSTGQLVTQILFEGTSMTPNAVEPTSGTRRLGQVESPGMLGRLFAGFQTPSIHSATDGFAPLRDGRNAFRWIWSSFRRLFAKRQTSSRKPGDSTMPKLAAIGVEFASNSDGPRQSITATREVIIAAGALHSPQLLMLSGIGPAAKMEELRIPSNIDLPGVGSNLQDHGRVLSWFPYSNDSFANPTDLAINLTFASEALTEYWTNRTGPLTAAAMDGVAFPSLPHIVNGSTAITATADAQSAQQYLPADVDNTIINGYTRQHALMLNALSDVTRAAYELLNSNNGVLTVANMRPFSRGTVTLNSSDPFTPPIIDPRYGSNPVDVHILQAALAFNRRLLYTKSMADLNPIQISPPPDASEDEIVQYIHDKWQTEYHPAGTCAMMPVELGGVVDPNLLVYGTKNLRVVDSSIMPMLPAAHLQAVVYGIAEKAADIIKAAQAVNGSVASHSTLMAPTADIASSIIGTTTKQTRLTLFPSPNGNAIATSTTFVTVQYTQTVYTS